MRSMVNSIKKSVFWKLFDRAGNALTQLLTQIIMARLLSPDDFGALSIMLVFVNIGNVIVQSGMNTALIQAKQVERIDCSTVFWMSSAISVFLYVIVFIFTPVIADFYSTLEIVWPLRVVTLLLPINAYNAVQVALITRKLEMRKIFRATVVSSIVSAILGIGSALLGVGLWSLVIQQLSYQLVNCLAHALQLNWRPYFEFSFSSAKRLFGFGSRLLASGILDQGYQSLSDLIIGRQFSAAQLGVVSQGKRYPQAIGNILDGAIQPVMLSAVSRFQSDAARVKGLVRRALKTSTFLIFPAMALFASVAPTLVPLLLGPQWSESVKFLQMYCVVYAFLPIHTTNLQALNGMGRSDLFLKLEIIKKVYGIASVLFFGLAVRDVSLLVASYIVTDFVSTIVNAWPNKKVIGYSYIEQARDIAPSFIFAAIAAGVSMLMALLPATGIILVLLQLIVYISIYLGLAAAFRLEELSYLVTTARDLLSGRRARR